MTFDIKRLSPHFAAEVTGFDAGAYMSPALIDFIEDAMAEYAVVVLPGQDISDDQQIAFAAYFGPRESASGSASGDPSRKNRLPKYLFDAGNLDFDGEILAADHPRRVMRAGDRLWHTDSSFNPMPTKWSMLSGRIVPPQGGNTEFADARAAYDALSDQMKARIEDLVAEHSIWHSREKGGMTEFTLEHEQSLPPVMHKLVRTIPRSGRKTFMVGAHARRIIGMDAGAGAALIQELSDFATRDEFVYSHKWRTGDLVIWDNRCTLHRGRPFEDLKYKRDMRRTTIDEYAPSWAVVG
jgi:alpha-ketoglutarate-dependent 2,4-dichlorophenoxyacetate dioxygenase